MKHLIHSLYYWGNVKTWIRPIIRINTKRYVEGMENMPKEGPLILACNHLNLADPALITALLPRRIVWMTKRELFDIPVLGLFYHLYGAIPVRRFEADLSALHKAQEALKRGQVLGMFPEGTRSLNGGLGKGYAGTALIALRTGAPVLPVAVWGTEMIKLPKAFFQRTPVHVRIGQPFTLPRVERIRTTVVKEGTEFIMGKIAELLPTQYRGVYTDAIPPKVAQDVGKS